jgi:L-lactate dehydrogenase (cytochrome)
MLPVRLANDVQVLSEELATAMKLLGITSLDQARPDMVNATALLNEMWRPEANSWRSRL